MGGGRPAAVGRAGAWGRGAPRTAGGRGAAPARGPGGSASTDRTGPRGGRGDDPLGIHASPAAPAAPHPGGAASASEAQFPQRVLACVQVSSTTELRRTPLYERHAAAGARLVPFAGWEMPVQYAGIREEHLAVRGGAGVFDVSHMGQVLTRGPDALAFLQRMLSNDVRRIPEGGAQYSVMCREDGGVLDDLFTYRLAECHYLTVTNAANHEKDLEWLCGRTDEFDVDVLDVASRFAMLAVQGPRARPLVRGLADGS